MLKKADKISDFLADNMMNWRHSGFDVYCGVAIFPDEEESLVRLAQYIVRAQISQERLLYIPPEKTGRRIVKVIYSAKDKSRRETFDAIDWLARLVTHIPNKGEQLIRYYGRFSSKSRGLRKKDNANKAIQSMVNSDISRETFRKNWARLIQNIYTVDPLKCVICSKKM